ncbi:PLP-dependent aminotransferase family protein [uncultured Veillonella sp.]|uniref:MocR-like pyridoxine biosynthesis transcription factor PdxR n=1 Tax=uncultured Veillonella sp. TaxID=159268 RepID=UPI00261E2170|nr:PLP-dependent aminotransferase family protein [uncultured Veillonella sp.]
MDLIALQNESEQPLYIQLYEGIKERIVNGHMTAQSKLPSKRYLMKAYNLSQNTVENALFLLQEEGYIVSEARRGYYVANRELLYKESNTHKASDVKVKAKDEFLYDFTYSGVDISRLPSKMLQKLAKEVYEETTLDFAFSGPVQGYEPLRQSICQYLGQSRGVMARPEQIVISAGTEYLFHIVFKLLPHELYGIENPGYKMLQQLFTTNEVAYCPISLDEQGLIVRDLEAQQVNVACVTPSHQFPTGRIMPIARRQALLNWVNGADNRYIIEDDYDSEFKYQGRPIPALKARDKALGEGRIIYMGSFSKSISPALRVSYMVLPDRLLAIYKKKMPYFGCPVGTVSQKVLHKFIEKGYFVKHLNRMRTAYKKKREVLVKALYEESARLLGQSVVIEGAEAGLHLVITLPKQIDEAKFMKACKEGGIKIYSLKNYFLPHSSSNEAGKMAIVKALDAKATDLELAALVERTMDVEGSSLGNSDGNINAFAMGPTFVLGYASLSRKEIQAGVGLLMKYAKHAMRK